mgnify:FL=1
MRLASPKYVPREWMLVSAYSAAQDGDYSQLDELVRARAPRLARVARSGPARVAGAEATGATASALRGTAPAHRARLPSARACQAELFRTPYDEHPELEAKYYRRTPDEMRQAGGVSYFS